MTGRDGGTPIPPRRAAVDLPPTPAGWRRVRDRFEPDGTVAGAAARRVEITARCRMPDCGRRLTLDLRALCGIGFGAAQVHDVRTLFECRRPGGCGLRWQPESYPAGVPLIALLDPLGGAEAVAIACDGCKRAKTYPPAELIRLLIRTGVGDGAVGTIELPSKVRGACQGCGRRAWSCLVVRASRPPILGGGSDPGEGATR